MRNAGRIDLLVNNAGAALAGALEETSLAEAKELFDVDFFFGCGPRHCRICGPLDAVASFSSARCLAFFPHPSWVSASKHAIEGYAETLDHEVRAFGIRSILVEPGFTANAARQGSTRGLTAAIRVCIGARPCPPQICRRHRTWRSASNRGRGGPRSGLGRDAEAALCGGRREIAAPPAALRPGANVRQELPAPVSAGQVKQWTKGSNNER
jgi:NAD(P)-dependent dehydrogenase (short-subunit alcohol dehydrogenase family)